MPETKQPASSKRRRKRFLIGGLGLFILVFLVYPLWLPWVLKPVAAHLGVQFQDCRRQGYAAFEFSKVQWASGSISGSAERLRLHTPHRILWARIAGGVSDDPQLQVEQWKLESQPAEEPPEPGMQSTGELLDVIQGVEPSLSRWVHSVFLTNGRVELPGKSLAVTSVTLQSRQLTVDALDSRANIDLTSLASASMELSVSNQYATAEIGFRRKDTGWLFDGDLLWESNRFHLNGRFDRSGWLPASATVDCDSLVVVSVLPGVDEFPDLQGSLRAAWSDDRYTFEVNLTDRVVDGSSSPFDQVSLQAGGRGDFRALELQRLEFAVPFLKATLDKPLTFDFGSGVEGGSATLDLWADLSLVEAIAAEGQLSGFLTVNPTIHSPLRLGFNLKGTQIAAAGVQTRSVAIDGRLDWPLLQVTNLVAGFESGGTFVADFELEVRSRLIGEADERSTLKGRGSDQFGSEDGSSPPDRRRQAASAPGDAGGAQQRGWHLNDLHWRFDGPLPVVLPESVNLKTIGANGSANGFWPDLTHTGRVEVSGFEAGILRAETARVQWSGYSSSIDDLRVSAESGSSSVRLTAQAGARVDDGGVRADVECQTLELGTADGAWQLEEPSKLIVLSRTNRFDASLSPLKVVGPGGRLTLQAAIDWPARGNGQINIKGFRTDPLADFLTPDVPQASVPDATAAFHWENGPLMFDSDVNVEWRGREGPLVALTGQVKSDGQSIQFDTVQVKLDNAACLEAAGNLPLRVEPAYGWRVVEPESGEEAHFEARIFKKGPVWTLIEERLGIRLDSPNLVLQATGTMAGVQGQLSFEADRLALPTTDTNAAGVIPELEQLRVNAVLGMSGVEIRQASAQLLGQGIEAQARWEIDAGDWKQWLTAVREPDWQRVTGRLLVKDAELSALSALLPGVIAPIGEVDLDLSLKPGLRVDGRLTITNGATRYLKPLGSLRDIHADIAMDGWSGTIHNFSGILGGQPVSLSGDLGWRSDGERRFDLRLSGRNLSLVRDPELFLRADLEVHLQKAFGEVAWLTGDVMLQHSLLFRDFNSLVGFDRTRPEARPPYFSVSQAPFRDWQLDVRLKGERFLHVISPAFRGEVSAGLQLLGTLREPFAIGAVTVDSGRVLFPFGTLQIDRGRVDLNREDPYRPRLDLRGEGQNYGYTITVDLTGPMDAPNLTFQSVPPLTAQQILLMLSAGEIPRSDFGYDTTDKASRVGLYIGKELVNRFVGNTSTTERLSLRSGENITDEGKPTYMIEYRLTDRWSAFGEYNRFRDFNSGLKFKVLSK